MGTRSYIKTGDTGLAVLRTLRIAGSVFDFSDSKWKSYVTAVDASGSDEYRDREVTSYQATLGDPENGQFAVPIFSGEGLPGASSGAVAVGAGDVVTVTVATSGDAAVDRQALYMTEAGGSDFYLVASGPDGFLSGGIAIGDPSYSPGAGEVIVGLSDGTPAADSVLVQAAPTVDESITRGETSAAASPTIASAVVSSPGTGTIDAGSHEFKAINIRAADSEIAQVVDFEMRVVDSTTGKPATLPSSGREQIEFEDAL